jgi:hypothetical protein
MVRWVVIGAAALWFGASAAPAAAQASVARAEQACIAAALQQLMIHRQTLSRADLRDGRGRVTGRVIVMEVRFLGRKTEVTCTFDAATARAVVEVGRKPVGVAPVPSADVVRACTRAAQRQNLMVDNVVSETPIRNRQGQTIGRSVLINVFQAGRPAQVQCDFDYASRDTALQIRRPAWNTLITNEKGRRFAPAPRFCLIGTDHIGGRITASITWITPFEAAMSAVEITAPLTLAPPSRVMVTSLP